MPQNTRRQNKTVDKQFESMYRELDTRFGNVEMRVSSLGESVSALTQEMRQNEGHVPPELQKVVNGLITQMRVLGKSHEQLAQTTVGTKEHQQAMDSMTRSVVIVAEIMAKLPGQFTTHYQSLSAAIQGILTPLREMADILSAIQELAREPLTLSDNAVKQLSSSMNAHLKPEIQKMISSSVDEERQRFEKSLNRATDAAVDRVDTQRKALERSANRAAVQAEKLNSLAGSLIRVMAPLAAIAVCVSLAGVGLANVLGFLDAATGWSIAMPAIWHRAVDSSTWYGHVGWTLAALSLIAGFTFVMVWAARKVWEIGEGFFRPQS